MTCLPLLLAWDSVAAPAWARVRRPCWSHFQTCPRAVCRVLKIPQCDSMNPVVAQNILGDDAVPAIRAKRGKAFRWLKGSTRQVIFRAPRTQEPRAAC